jgi:integrase
MFVTDIATTGISAVESANVQLGDSVVIFGTRRLGSIRPEHVRAYVAAKLGGSAPVREQPDGKGGRIKRRLSAKTINNQVTLLGLVLGHACADGIIPSNPAAGRDRRRPLKLKEPHRERDYLRPHEVPLYLAACSDFWYPRALTLILTGSRVGELLALRWDDVDWRGAAIVIGRAVKADGVGSTKGDETGRRVDVGPRLAAACEIVAPGKRSRPSPGTRT